MPSFSAVSGLRDAVGDAEAGSAGEDPRPMETHADEASQAGKLAPFILQARQQAFEVLTARAAGPQMRRHARVTLLGGTTGGGYLGVDVQYLHRLGASHI